MFADRIDFIINQLNDLKEKEQNLPKDMEDLVVKIYLLETDNADLKTEKTKLWQHKRRLEKRVDELCAEVNNLKQELLYYKDQTNG